MRYSLYPLTDVRQLGTPELAEEIGTAQVWNPPAGWNEVREGSFRIVFWHDSQPDVVYKVSTDDDQDKQANEVNAVLTFRQDDALRPYLPDVYYYVISTGAIVVVMERIPLLKKTDRATYEDDPADERFMPNSDTHRQIHQAFDRVMCDLHTHNYGIRENGQPVVLDFSETNRDYSQLAMA